MQIYLAAVYTNAYMPGQNMYGYLNDFERNVVDTQVISHNLLESYHYVYRPSYVDIIRKNKTKIFLDSGAFSAHTLGAELSIADYCQYIKDNDDIIRYEDGVLLASVLDGIGDALQTYRNQLEMEKRGVRPLPCFHVGEDERYLEWYIRNYEYITLGGMVQYSPKQLVPWLDRIWNKYLLDGSGKPKVKVHGFGLTSVPLMENYDWYSCDSSSWIQSTSFGNVFTPAYGSVRLSVESNAKHETGKHVESLTEKERNEVVDYINSTGFEYDRLTTRYRSRAAFNMWAYMETGGGR